MGEYLTNDSKENSKFKWIINKSKTKFLCNKDRTKNVAEDKEDYFSPYIPF